MLQRFSFRQLLVVAFLLTAALLGAASLRALFALEDLTVQSRDNAARALDLSGAAQSLREGSMSMERSARGPKREPGRLVTPRSIGTPVMATCRSPKSGLTASIGW